MDALILTMFVSLVLACGGVAMFVWLAGARTFDHADRLALLPMEEDFAPEEPSNCAARRNLETSAAHRAAHVATDIAAMRHASPGRPLCSSSASLRAADAPCVRPVGRDNEKDPKAS